MKNKLIYLGGIPTVILCAIGLMVALAGELFPIVFNLVFGFVVFIGYLYLAIVQFSQVIRPRDWLTNLRILIFVVLLMTIVTFIPSLAYQAVRLSGQESEFLRGVVNITGRISSVCILVILVYIFKYKKQENDE